MNTTTEQGTVVQGKRSGKIWIVLTLLIGLLAGGGGAAAYYFYVDRGAPGAASAEAEPVEISDPIYLKVGPMTVNIQSNRGDRLLYISMMVKVGDEETKRFLETNMPDVNNRMLILLSQQRAESLNALEGKELVAEKILESLAEPFSDPQPELAIESVFFQDFIVQ